MTEPVQQEHRASARHKAAIRTHRGSQCPPRVPSSTCPATTTHISALLRFRASVMISCSRTETSSAGGAGRVRDPQPGSTAPSFPTHAIERGEGSAQGPSRKLGGTEGWGLCGACAHVSSTYVCAAVHTCSCTCAYVFLRALWSCYVLQPCRISACQVLCQLASPFCNHSPTSGQGSPQLGTETPVPSPSRAEAWVIHPPFHSLSMGALQCTYPSG